MDGAQAAIAKAIDDNITGNLPSGDPPPKRPPRRTIGKKVIIGGLATELLRSIIDPKGLLSESQQEQQVAQPQPSVPQPESNKETEEEYRGTHGGNATTNSNGTFPLSALRSIVWQEYRSIINFEFSFSIRLKIPQMVLRIVVFPRTLQLTTNLNRFSNL